MLWFSCDCIVSIYPSEEIIKLKIIIKAIKEALGECKRQNED